jgi:co-chaperonin GroES (HSP10)
MLEGNYMEQFVLPESFNVPKPIEAVDQPDLMAPDAVKAKTVPMPTGYRLLCMVPEVKETFDGTGILKAEDVRRTEELTSHVLFVLEVGPEAYKDEKKFSYPWCKKGDFVMTRAYAGTRFKVFGREFRVINDDQVECTIEDPRGVARV